MRRAISGQRAGRRADRARDWLQPAVLAAVDPRWDAWGWQERGQPVTLRWIILHMIEETARHAGHPDTARELRDGRTGPG